MDHNCGQQNKGSICLIAGISSFVCLLLYKNTEPLGLSHFLYLSPILKHDYVHVNVTNITHNNITWDKKFDDFFENNQIQAFKDNYNAQCFPGRPVFGGIIYDNGYNAGYGAVMNSVLIAFLISAQPEVDRSFQLIHYRYQYTNPANLFHDFAKDTSCPIFPTIKAREMSQLINISRTANYNVSFNNVTNLVEFSGPEKAALMFATKKVGNICDIIRELRVRDGNQTIGHLQTGFLRALWNPLPALKEIIRKMWMSLVGVAGSGYFGVHLRGGDKVTMGEMDAIPLRNYTRHLMEWCVELKNKCPKMIFVASDEDNAAEKFRRRLRKQFIVKDVNILARNNKLLLEEFEPVALNGKSPFRTHFMSPEKWDRHTKELVITITLLAMSDYLLCTLSSNLCRFISQMRGPDENRTNLHSLDLPVRSC